MVRRGLQLIAGGALDEGDVKSLAATLGLGARQLRRLFTRHLGASPAAIGGARRAHFAATLLAETDRPITEVAFAAGFNSIRQFNHAIRARFGEAPTELRRVVASHEPRRRGVSRDGGGLNIRLPYRAPLDWAAIIRFLKPRATPGIEVVDDSSYRRTIELGGCVGTIDVRPVAREPHLVMRVQLPSYEGLSLAVERARRLFDLDADPLHITEHLRVSPQMRRLVEQSPGLRLPGVWDGFELAVRAVLGERLTAVKVTRLAGRLVKVFGTKVNLGERGLTHLFPSPRALAEADLTHLGVSAVQATAIRRIATAAANGTLSLNAVSDPAEIVSRLSAIPGCDQVTAHYIAMRGLGDPDAFPAHEIGLRRALANGGSPFATSALECLAEGWRPWRAYAAMYLWAAQSC